MKTLFSFALLSLMMLSSACARNEQVISFEQLPPKAQTFLKNSFAVEEISYVMHEKEGLDEEYEVKFASGAKLEFDKTGGFKKVDCGLLAVPDGIVPEAVVNYVKTKFPKEYITEWGKDDRHWKAELSNGLDLLFDKDYKYVGMDD